MVQSFQIPLLKIEDYKALRKLSNPSLLISACLLLPVQQIVVQLRLLWKRNVAKDISFARFELNDEQLAISRQLAPRMVDCQHLL